MFSKLAVFDGQKPIRGGIPIVFRKYLQMFIGMSLDDK